MTYATKCPGEKELLHFGAIHQSAVQVARDKYFQVYGVYHTDDPEYEIDGLRHAFWLDAYDSRTTALILNPYQD